MVVWGVERGISLYHWEKDNPIGEKQEAREIWGVKMVQSNWRGKKKIKINVKIKKIQANQIETCGMFNLLKKVLTGY